MTLDLKAKAEKLVEALEKLIDPSPCRFDHEGYCQNHRVENPCSNSEAVKVFDQWHKENKEEE